MESPSNVQEWDGVVNVYSSSAGTHVFTAEVLSSKETEVIQKLEGEGYKIEATYESLFGDLMHIDFKEPRNPH